MTLIILFIFGVSIGSFLNVVIDRLPQGKSIIVGRSLCDHCKHVLAWYDLIPILSFFLLGARCRYCGKKISRQYPTVELITGSLFVFTYIHINSNFLFDFYHLSLITYHLLIISGLIVVFFTDLKYRIIPDRVLIFLTSASFIFLAFFEKVDFTDHLEAAVVLSLFFLFLLLITRGKGMGLGDVKYAFVMGLILGIYASIIAFYLSFLTGAVISLILVITGKKSFKSTIPFGPFLVVGTGVALFYGQMLWEGFRKMIGI